jgi:hypothetical protein
MPLLQQQAALSLEISFPHMDVSSPVVELNDACFGIVTRAFILSLAPPGLLESKVRMGARQSAEA